MKVLRYICVLSLLCGILGAGCTTDPADVRGGEANTMLYLSAQLKDTAPGTVAENAVTTLRVIVFESATGNQLVNSLLTAEEVAKTLGPDGRYTISFGIAEGVTARAVLIANEKTPNNYADLYQTLSEILNAEIDYVDSTTGDLVIQPPCMMFSQSVPFTVSKSMPAVAMQLERTIAKATIALTFDPADNDLPPDAFIEPYAVTLLRLPAPSHLSDNNSTLAVGEVFYRTETVDLVDGVNCSLSPDGSFTTLGDGVSFYLPEYHPVDADLYTYAQVYAHHYPVGRGGEMVDVVYRIPLGDNVQRLWDPVNPAQIGDLTTDDLTITRNVWYKVAAAIRSAGTIDGMHVTVKVDPWVAMPVDGDMGAPYLNLSYITAYIPDGGISRIYFWSNQPAETVFIESVGYLGATGTQPFDVNSFFDQLGFTSELPHPANLVFTGPNSGYFDLQLSPAATRTLGNDVRRIYLRANGLRREITVTANTLPEFTDWSSIPYVGTFHRWNQVGERIIAANNTGAWTAEVVDGDFIVLSTDLSADPAVGTETPGDAEDYPVESRRTYVEGRGKIYFRVGLTGSLFQSNASPRYGRIRVTTSSGVRDLYVRQGEAADYLMNIDERVVSSEITSRPLAQRVAPYNLSVPTPYDGSDEALLNPSLPTNGGVFVQFPTQSGYFFQYGGNRTAFHPSLYSVPTSWNNSINLDSWDTQYETCPPGYRRISDGPYNTAPNDFTVSEICQSLCYGIGVRLGQLVLYTENDLYGFYADGFFDRRQPGRALQVSSGATVAFVGHLVYNPENNASLFFPSSGFRTQSSGVIDRSSYLRSYFGSSTPMNIDLSALHTWVTWVGTPDGFARIVGSGQSLAIPIRCVHE